MSFKVDPDPQVLQAVSRLSATLQDFYTQVLSILEENPYRFRDLIHKNTSGDGRVFYQYFDGIIPLVFLYRVIPPEHDWTEGDPGFVYIFEATPAWW
jgi:hypothetical protein